MTKKELLQKIEKVEKGIKEVKERKIDVDFMKVFLETLGVVVGFNQYNNLFFKIDSVPNINFITKKIQALEEYLEVEYKEETNPYKGYVKRVGNKKRSFASRFKSTTA